MAKGWNCARCGTENPETSLTCSNCRLIRGAVWVPTAQSQQPAAPSESTGWGASTQADPNFGQAASAGGGQLGSTVWAAGATPAPAAGGQSSILRMIPLNWIVIGLIAVATAVGGWYFSAGRGTSGEIDRAGEMSATELRVGDCFDLKDPDAEELSDVNARPCASEHEYEIVYLVTLPSGAYPADSVFDAYLESHCVPSFATYIGKPYQDSALAMSWLAPTEASWDEGDRILQCVVWSPNQSRLTSSLKGSGF